MRNETLHQLVDSMPSDQALDQIAHEIRHLFSHIPEDARINFLVRLMGDSSQNEGSSLVHL